MLIASIILYLLGGVAGYFLFRKIAWSYKEEEKWTVMDRLITIMLCLLSWVTIFIFLVTYVLHENKCFDPDKEVTW